jgi:hypothetical protein
MQILVVVAGRALLATIRDGLADLLKLSSHENQPALFDRCEAPGPMCDLKLALPFSAASSLCAAVNNLTKTVMSAQRRFGAAKQMSADAVQVREIWAEMSLK